MRDNLKRIVNFLLYFYNKLIVVTVRLEDKQKREAQYKRENLDPNSLEGKIRYRLAKFGYMIGSKKFSLKEQKDLIETLKTSVKYSNPITQPFIFMSTRRDLRLVVRAKSKQVADDLMTQDLHETLRGKDMLADEYITLIEVASETGEYLPTFDSIIESINDKVKRKKVFLVLLIQPILTLIMAVGIEAYVALSVVPELLMNISPESAPPTLKSYISLRDILIEDKLEYTIKILIVLAVLFVFFKIPATKVLMNLLVIQIPYVNKLIAQWEVSKFFDSIHAMVLAGASMQEATQTAIGLINNTVIRSSLIQDLQNLGTKTNDLSDLLADSIYVDLKIRNQLLISKESKSDGNDVLTSVVNDYKDTMKTLLDAPLNLVIPLMLASGGVYLFGRLMPLFMEIQSITENIQ